MARKAKLAENSRAEPAKKKRGRGPGRPFKAGKSGNPGGRPKDEREVVDALRLKGAELAEALLKLALAKKPNVKAIAIALDRAYGKAKQVVEVGGKDGGPIRHRLDFSKLTIEQRKEMLALVIAARALPAGE